MLLPHSQSGKGYQMRRHDAETSQAHSGVQERYLPRKGPMSDEDDATGQ
jgi:hypothetical protein